MNTELGVVYPIGNIKLKLGFYRIENGNIVPKRQQPKQWAETLITFDILKISKWPTLC